MRLSIVTCVVAMFVMLCGLANGVSKACAQDVFGDDSSEQDPFGDDSSDATAKKEKVVPIKHPEIAALPARNEVLSDEIKTLRANREALRAEFRAQRTEYRELRNWTEKLATMVITAQRERKEVDRAMEIKLEMIRKNCYQRLELTQAKLKQISLQFEQENKIISRKNREGNQGRDTPGHIRLREMSAMSEGEKCCRETLDEVTAIEFVDVPIDNVFDYLEDLHNTQIAIDRSSLKKAGIQVEDIIVNENILGATFRASLQQILDHVDSSSPLTYAIRDGMILVTTVASGKDREVAVYDVTKLLDDGETAGEFAKNLTRILRLDSPNEAQAERLTLDWFKGKLIAIGPECSQYKLAKFLGSLAAEKRTCPK